MHENDVKGTAGASGLTVSEPVRGRWFSTFGYWLFPSTVKVDLKQIQNILDHPMPDLGREYKAPTPSNRSEPSKVATKEEAIALATKLREYVKYERSTKTSLYNAQPSWRLRELPIESVDSVRAAACEFLRMVDETSVEFVWPVNEPVGDMRWREHGWKHISYAEILDIWDDYRLGMEPAPIRAEALGGNEEIRRLFVAAANRDPEAVGIVWSLFPKAEDHVEIIEMFFGFHEKPRGIPAPASLAADLVETIFVQPGSDEAEKAREALRRLISVSVSKGTRTRKGRPKVRLARSSLRLLWKMSYCLVLQAIELDGFLGRCKSLDKDRNGFMLNAYPWIKSVSRDPTDFLSYEPSKAALKVVSHITGISPSYLEKMRLRSIG